MLICSCQINFRVSFSFASVIEMKNFACVLLFLQIICSSNILAQSELDLTFNSSGKVRIEWDLTNVEDTAVQPDNKIVYVSSCNIAGTLYSICLGRLNENGTYDTTFGSTSWGIVRKHIPDGLSGGTSTGLALQNDGKIVVLGNASFGSREIFLARFNTDGTIDTSFGTDGVAKTNSGEKYYSDKIKIQPDGKFVVTGYNDISFSDFRKIVLRFNSDGTLDQTFSGDGIIQINIAGHQTQGSDVALQPDGKIVTAGKMWTIAENPNRLWYSLMTRLNPDGTLDTTFDEDGIKNINSPFTNYFNPGFHSVAVQSDGKILGLSNNNELHRFNADGSPDTGFDGDGIKSVLTVNSRANDVIVSPSGRVTVVGERIICECFPRVFDYHVGKYLPNGSPDPGFSSDGYHEIDFGINDFGSVGAYDTIGRVIVGGYSAQGSGSTPNTFAHWSIARLNTAPAQNAGFTGRVTKADGRAVANAYITLKNGSEIIAYSRTNPFGYFRFANVPSNITYTLSTVSKNLNFYDRNVLVDGEIENYWIAGTD